MKYYIAQLLSIVGCILLTISCKQKTQKRVMILQCCECILSIIAVLLLGGYTGAIVTGVALIRNLLSATGKNTKLTTIMLVAASIILSLVNSKSILDMIPAIAGVTYTLALYKNNIKITKIAFAINSSLWLIYDLTIGAWVYVAFNALNTAICLYEIHKMKGLNTEG